MNNWSLKKLNDIVEPASGTWGNQNNSGTAVFRSVNIVNDGTISFDNIAYCDIPEQKVNTLALQDGDILLEKSGGSPAQPVGRVALFNGSTKGRFVFGNFIQRLRPKTENKRFLFYYLLHFYRNGAINLYQNQTTGIRNLIVKKYLSMSVPIPSVEVQQKIVSTLDSIRKLQEIDKDELVKTEKLFNLFLKNNFVHQQNWKIEKISGLVKISGGGTPSKSNANYWTGDIPWVSPKDMKSFEISDTEDHISNDAVKNSSTTIIPKQAILIVFRSGILKHSVPLGITTRDVALNQDMKALICGEKILPRFLFFWMIANTSIIKSCIKTGGTVQSIDSKKFSSLGVSFPDIEEQRKLISQADSLLELVNKKREAEALLQELFDSVLNKAMKGELVQ